MQWAERNRVVVVEDDYDSEFRYGGRPLDALQGLDNSGSVIYLGTFSKVLFTSLRLGFVVAPPKLYQPFLAAKWITNRHTETGEQRIISEFIREGHLARMQRVYFDRQQVLIECLQRHLPAITALPAVADRISGARTSLMFGFGSCSASDIAEGLARMSKFTRQWPNLAPAR